MFSRNRLSASPSLTELPDHPLKNIMKLIPIYIGLFSDTELDTLHSLVEVEIRDRALDRNEDIGDK